MSHFKQNFVTQRFADIVKALKAEKKINSYAQLAKKLNYRPQSLNEILKGRRNVNIEVLYQFFQNYPVDPGQMFDTFHSSEELQNDKKNNTSDSPVKPFPKIKFIESTQTLDWMLNYDDPSFYEKLRHFEIPIKKNESQDFISLCYSGNMMCPTLEHNDILIAEKKSLNSVELTNGEIYIILSLHGLHVLRLDEYSEDNKIILLGDNQSKIKLQIHKSEIHAIYQVKAKITPRLDNQKYAPNATSITTS